MRVVCELYSGVLYSGFSLQGFAPPISRGILSRSRGHSRRIGSNAGRKIVNIGKKVRQEDPYTGLKCQQCGAMTGITQVCPYQREFVDSSIPDEEMEECTCCPSCAQQCAHYI